MKAFLALSVFGLGLLIGNKIGFGAAKAKYYGAYQESNWKYGCSLKQQMPNGDCP